MTLDDCVTCGKPKEVHYGPLKTCKIYPTYRSVRDVLASVDRSPEGGDRETGRHAEHESAVPKADAQ